jgi:hypothetical protein
MQHDVITVYTFLKKVLNYLKEQIPESRHVKYFSDGAASQYKNYKNLSNLCKQEQDFDLTADWNFFATSHGKSACDGIGGTVICLAA